MRHRHVVHADVRGYNLRDATVHTAEPLCCSSLRCGILLFWYLQLQQQLWATEAERSRQAAADTLAKISLCRRVLRHFAAVAAETGQWRRLKQTAQQRGRSRVLRWVIPCAAMRLDVCWSLQQVDC